MHHTAVFTPKIRHAPATRPAFTLVELLVVIGILVLLMAILIPVLSSARESARRAKCAAQLREIGQALTAYATSNDGAFPDHGNEGNTFFNINYASRKALGDQLLREVFYCPTDLPDYKDGWNAPLPNGTIPPQPGAQTIPFITVGYVLLYNRTAGPLNGPPNAGIGPRPITNPPPYSPPIGPADVFPMPRPQSLRTSSAVLPLACDPILSSTASLTTNFQIRTHMNRKGFPTGQNVLYMDGHVAWVPLAAADLASSPTHSAIIYQYQDQSAPLWSPPGLPGSSAVYWFEYQRQSH